MNAESMKSRCFLAVLSLGALLAGSTFVAALDRRPVDSEAPSGVRLVWNDGYRLFPALAVPALQREVSELFARHELSVSLVVAVPGEPLATFRRPKVNAILSPRPSSLWNLPKDALAAAVGERDKSYTIFVFFPELLRAVGLRDRPSWSPRELARLTRAMGRVLAHELVHALAPERGHAETGLMAEHLSTRILVGDDVHLDVESRRWARAALREWAEVAERRNERETRDVEIAPARPLPTELGESTAWSPGDLPPKI